MDLNEHRERTNQENRFMVHNGMRLVVLEADRAVVELEVGPESLNLLGAVHGGVYFTMADCAAGAAARSGGSAYVTCDADIHFIRGAKSGLLRATAQVRHRGSTTCRVSVEITDGDGRLLCDVSCTMFRVDTPAPQ